MKLYLEGGAFVALPSTHLDDQEARQAGFAWDVRARLWRTTSATVASRLHRYATGTLAARLAPLVEAHRASSAVHADLDVPAPAGRTYLPFQKAGIAFLLAHSKCLLADEMGTGKTIQTLGLINADPSISRVLVICPASIKLNWRREAQAWLTRKFNVRVLMPGDHVSEIADGDFLIVNYDILDRFPALQFAQLDLLVVDECHALKNSGTKRSKMVAGIQARREAFLTGTPIPNRVREIWPVASRLAAWPDETRRRFEARFCCWDNLKWDELPLSRRQLEERKRDVRLAELQDALRKTIMIRRLKDQVLTELPPKFRQIVKLDPGTARAIVQNEVNFYDHWQAEQTRLKAEVEAARARNQDEYKAAVERLRDTVTAGWAEMAKLRHQTALAKLPHVIARLKEMIEDGGQKIVCFAHHIDVIHQISDAFPGSVRLLGETSQADRQIAVDRFQRAETVRLFVGSIYAAGEGITLTAARTAVFGEMDWVPAKLSQAEDRLHRIGQKDSVLVQHLVFDESLDARMARVAIEKQALADGALNRRTA